MIPDLMALIWSQEPAWKNGKDVPFEQRVEWYKFSNELQNDMYNLGLECDYIEMDGSFAMKLCEMDTQGYKDVFKYR